ncbi:MAG: hypothetical protein EPN47_20130 [Acidobacteria bacterium]|nr:MAG: hypothetical protein EPN47_20130 [Acidobacteriota bacterium]
MKKSLKTLWKEEKAEGMPEYALLLFLVSLTVVSAMNGVAKRVNNICLSASIHMTAVRNPALVGGAMSYTSETPANPYSIPKGNNQEINR